MLTIERICVLIEQGGSFPSLEGAVTLLEHSLQTAALAQRDGASAEMVCAALLHDLGRIAINMIEMRALLDEDDLPHSCMIPLLEPLFRSEVYEPMRLQEEARRYRCAIDFEYYLRLSANARSDVEAQGGMFTPGEATEFIKKPYANDALRLCGWDDRAHVKGLKTPALSDFVPVMRNCVALKQAMRAMYSRVLPNKIFCS